MAEPLRPSSVPKIAPKAKGKATRAVLPSAVGNPVSGHRRSQRELANTHGFRHPVPVFGPALQELFDYADALVGSTVHPLNFIFHATC